MRSLLKFALTLSTVAWVQADEDAPTHGSRDISLRSVRRAAAASRPVAVARSLQEEQECKTLLIDYFESGIEPLNEAEGAESSQWVFFDGTSGKGDGWLTTEDVPPVIGGEYALATEWKAAEWSGSRWAGFWGGMVKRLEPPLDVASLGGGEDTELQFYLNPDGPEDGEDLEYELEIVLIDEDGVLGEKGDYRLSCSVSPSHENNSCLVAGGGWQNVSKKVSAFVSKDDTAVGKLIAQVVVIVQTKTAEANITFRTDMWLFAYCDFWEDTTTTTTTSITTTTTTKKDTTTATTTATTTRTLEETTKKSTTTTTIEEDTKTTTTTTTTESIDESELSTSAEEEERRKKKNKNGSRDVARGEKDNNRREDGSGDNESEDEDKKRRKDDSSDEESEDNEKQRVIRKRNRKNNNRYNRRNKNRNNNKKGRRRKRKRDEG